MPDAPENLTKNFPSKNLTQDFSESPFPIGTFPSERFHALLPYQRNDSNIFFTAITAFTLQTLCQHLSTEEQSVVEKICRGAEAAYPHYRNRRGRATYNFWQKSDSNPDGGIPNSFIFSRLGKFAPPDDADTTSMIYLVTDRTPDEAAALHHHLQAHSNLKHRTASNALEKYRRLPAYSTWFGSPQMPIDFDVCVMTNILSFIHHYRLPRCEEDRATLEILRRVIEDGDYFIHRLHSPHLRSAYRISASYPRPVLILYHLARLISIYSPPELFYSRDKLIADIERCLASSLPVMEKILLSTSLMRLGVMPPEIFFPDIETAIKKFYFFIFSVLTGIEHPLVLRLASHPALYIQYRCDAHTLALLLENVVLRRS